MPQPRGDDSGPVRAEVYAKASRMNSLTPARPVMLTHTGPDSGARSISNLKNGQHLRSKEIHSASCGNAIRSTST